ASALLTYLAKQVPDLIAHSDFIAILGAAKTLANHPTEGLKLLESPVLAGQPEIELWEAVAHAELRDWAAAEEKFALTETILNGYPEPFYSRFSVLAIEAALAMSKDREAADWIDRMENGPHRDEINPALAYLHGVLHAKAGRGPAAEAAWKEAQASRDRLYKIRAELALIDLGVSNGSLTPAQAADRLEALRFGWRGDDLEVDILHRLGQFYIQSKNIKAGLGILSRATMLYPNSSLTPQIRDEMSGIFHDVFLGNLGKNLTPLDALTLYQQYRGLMPAGQDGIVVTHNLAERLVAIDLLDQAADLLEDLVKNKLQGDEKAKTSSRLAAIRLLDHKPEAAMAALEYVKDEGLSDTLRNERVLLRAKAFADMRRDDDALKLLEDNTSQAAKLLRADITMHAQRWDEAGKALLALIGPAGPEGTKATPQQAEWLVNAAIALSLAGDQTELDKLAIDYGPMMVGTNQNDTFRILTQPEKTAQLRDIASAQAKIADIDMFHSFLDNYRSKGSAKDAGAKTTAP
ncbi:MAG: tetratricopeptide repeat protein, partial [Alphaproteobacteria bacterium]